MRPAAKPRWQQATALVSLSVGGVITGFSFVPGSPAGLTSPASLPITLLALEKSAQQAPPSDEAMLRSAIVHVARHFLRMAEHNSPAEMEAIIWQHASTDGADHGPSCAAFASLTLELGSQVVGQQSWVTGGTSYPWPLHGWADGRVDPNPASPGVVSVLQDAEAHHRWHPLGDGYRPQPGDWVLFDGHVEVVTGYAGGALQTIGGDSLPNFSVNAHEYRGPLSGQGVAGFVDNGLHSAAPPAQGQSAAAGNAAPAPGHDSAPAGNAGPAPGGNAGGAAPGSAAGAAPGARSSPAARAGQSRPASPPRRVSQARPAAAPGQAPAARPASDQVFQPRAIPVPPEVQRTQYLSRSRALAAAGALPTPPTAPARRAEPIARPVDSRAQGPQPPGAQHQPRGHPLRSHGGPANHVVTGGRVGRATIPGTGMRPATHGTAPGQAAIPGLYKRLPHPSATPGELAPYQRHQVPASAQPQVPATAAQLAFIKQVAPGAMASQRKYGIPASVTIAQAIDESGWGQSLVATKDRNLFGIKGTGPAGSDLLPTQEYTNGRLVDTAASFRMYYDIAQSIEAHGKLLASSGYYTRAMANRDDPNAFAAALTGVYATDPSYGAKLIELMQRYHLYRYDAAPPAEPGATVAPGGAAIPGTGHGNPANTGPAAPRPGPARHPGRPAHPAPAPHPGRSSRPPHLPHPAPSPDPARTPAPGRGTPHVPTARTAEAAAAGGAAIPGVQGTGAGPGPAAHRGGNGPGRTAPAGAASRAGAGGPAAGPGSQIPGVTQAASATRATTTAAADRPPVTPRRYQQHLPPPVGKAFLTSAKVPLVRGEALYTDVAGHTGIPWQLLAACDWMQCKARAGRSPVYGEKLGMVNPDGTSYRTRSAALERCAFDLVALARSVYQIDVTRSDALSVRDLANVFAAYRWGGLLKEHHTSAMEFPYSVAGLTPQHMHMRWPNIDDPDAPDKPGARFHQPFGAVPIVLGLSYPATV